MTAADLPSRRGARAPWRFTRWRRAGFAAALALLALTAGPVALRGLPLGLDLTGGAFVEATAADAIDSAIAETLRRTLMTSATTLAATVSLMLFGGPALLGFAATVSFGVVAGAVSSIVVAAPLPLHLPGRGPAPDPFGAEAS